MTEQKPRLPRSVLKKFEEGPWATVFTSTSAIRPEGGAHRTHQWARLPRHMWLPERLPWSACGVLLLNGPLLPAPALPDLGFCL